MDKQEIKNDVTDVAGATDERVEFASPDEWAAWLYENHETSGGIWMRLYKTGSGTPSITYAQALDEALCYGWIDGQKRGLDNVSWLQRFVPRRPKSLWSKINREHIARLTGAGRMRAAGLKVVEEAKRDGRWDAAYDSQSQATVPDDLREALDANAAAKTFFEGLNSANRYSILHRLMTAKRPETRQKRLREYVEMLSRGEKLHP